MLIRISIMTIQSYYNIIVYIPCAVLFIPMAESQLLPYTPLPLYLGVTDSHQFPAYFIPTNMH